MSYRKLFLYILIFIAVFIFAGCSFKESTLSSKSYMVAIRLKNLAYSDVGFLNRDRDFTDLQLYDAGNLVLEIKIGKYICLNGNCFDKKEFNYKFLCKAYKKDILENILNAKTIFDGLGYQKTDRGFMQIIKQKGMYIKYVVNSDKIYFKDSKNRILIKLKELRR